jgi:hypothetical protein
MLKIPVVVYEEGRRKIIGTAHVEVNGAHIAVLATISPKYARAIGDDIKQFSFGPIPHKED